jgi:serine/threonine protein kinase/WD40 repeat protein
VPDKIQTDSESTVAYRPARETTADGNPPDADGAIPDVPGYQIVGELGRGGMGVVYLARQIAVDRVVALKMVLNADVAPKEFLARFRGEAEAAARLKHPNIVQLYEFGEAHGRPYFSSELVDGGSLADRWDSRPQPFEEVADLIATLADAMHYAHSLGIVHRDLKPANVLMSDAATPKIADFGLAKRLDLGHGQTATGMVLGTPGYMPPEQATGQSKNIGPAADIYALGAMLYEGITGGPPFRGATPYETILQVAQLSPVPPRRLRPETPRDLETICMRCLAKEPAKRYATAQALAEDLRRFRRREPIAARPPTMIERVKLWSRRHPARAAAMATVAAAAVALLAMGIHYHLDLSKAYRQVQSEKEFAHRQMVGLTLANGSRLAETGDFLSALPWYVEALRLDEKSDRADVHRLRIATTLKLCPELLAVRSDESPVIDAVVRPDGKAVAALRDDGSIHLWNLERLNEPAKVFRASRDSGSVRFPDSRNRLLSFDPSGRWLIARANDCANCIDTSEPTPMAIDICKGNGPVAWLNPLPLMLFGSNDALGNWNPATPFATSPVIPSESAITAIAATARGEFFATGHRNGEARLWTTGDWKSNVLPATFPGPITHLHFHPDGRRLLIVSGSTASVWDLEEQRVVGMPMRHSQDITVAAWSPDGSTIATASIDDTARLWNADTGQPIGDSLKHGSDVLRVAFSPDGRLVASGSDDDTARVWSARTGEAHSPPLLHNGTVTSVCFGTDARMLITASEDGTVKLWRLENVRDDPPPRLAREVPTRLPLGSDGRFELVADANGSYRAHDSVEKDRTFPAITHPGGLVAIDVNPNGQSIVTGGNDRTARIWDWKTGTELTPPLRYGGRVVDVVFSPDGRLVGAASDDNSARVWNAATGESITPLLWHNGAVRHVRFSPDSRFVLTASKAELAYLWEIATGEEIAPIRTRESWVQAALKSKRSATSWPLDIDRRTIEELTGLGQWLSGQHVDSVGGLAPISVEEFRRLARHVKK